MYSLYVYDKNIQRQGIIENIESLQWLSLYGDAGEVKLVCTATSKNKLLLKRGMRLWCTEQQESAKITQVEIDDNGKTSKITVRAPLSISRWKKRVVMGTVLITNIEAAMLKIAEDNRRRLIGITAAANGYEIKTDSQTSWGNVLDTEIALAVSSGLGFRERFNAETSVEIFEVYSGADRTVEGSDNFIGYFGDDIGNVSNVKIKDNEDDWYNVAVIAGQGQGADRRIEIVSLGIAEGDERRELWVDAKDIALTYQLAVPTGEIDDEGNPKYIYETHAYSTRGAEKLLEKVKELTVTVDVTQDLMRYGVDYFLGDIMPIKLVGYNLRLSTRLAGVKTAYEKSGRKITLQLENIAILKE